MCNHMNSQHKGEIKKLSYILISFQTFRIFGASWGTRIETNQFPNVPNFRSSMGKYSYYRDRCGITTLKYPKVPDLLNKLIYLTYGFLFYTKMPSIFIGTTKWYPVEFLFQGPGNKAKDNQVQKMKLNYNFIARSKRMQHIRQNGF